MYSVCIIHSSWAESTCYLIQSVQTATVRHPISCMRHSTLKRAKLQGKSQRVLCHYLLVCYKYTILVAWTMKSDTDLVTGLGKVMRFTCMPFPIRLVDSPMSTVHVLKMKYQDTPMEE